MSRNTDHSSASSQIYRWNVIDCRQFTCNHLLSLYTDHSSCFIQVPIMHVQIEQRLTIVWVPFEVIETFVMLISSCDCNIVYHCVVGSLLNTLHSLIPFKITRYSITLRIKVIVIIIIMWLILIHPRSLITNATNNCYTL